MNMHTRMKWAARQARLRVWRAQRRSSQFRNSALPQFLGAREEVDHFDYWSYREELLETISGTLTRSGIEHVVIPHRLLRRPLVVIRREDAIRSRVALAGDGDTAPCYIAQCVGSAAAPALPVGWPQALLPQTTGMLVTRNLIAPDGLSLIHPDWGVLVDLWDDLPDAPLPPLGNPPAGSLVARTPNGIIGHIAPEVWRQAQAAGHRLADRPTHLLQVNEPVDLVYTWVDGSDPAWQARKAQYLGTGLSDQRHSSDAAIAARFESRDELRYSLRSVQMFANWVRHIWIVTDNQVPSWLRTDHPKLTVVDHRDIFRDPVALPSFNSHAIESQLHHIDGLANLWLYLNDDVLFGSPVRPETFFHGNGRVKFFPSSAQVEPREPSSHDVAVTAAAKNNRAFLERTYGRTITNKLRHTVHPQSTDLLGRFEAEHPELFDGVMRARFRRRSDYAICSSLAQHYGFVNGLAVPARIRNGYVDLAHPLAVHVLEKWLRQRDYHTLCINDSGSTGTQIDGALADFFDSYFPLPSEWERS